MANSASGGRKYLLPFLSAAVAMLAGALIFIIPPPQSTQLYETAVEQYQHFTIEPDINIDLNENSAITVTNSQPTKIELLRGSAYFDVEGGRGTGSKLEAIVGNARIRDIGARFSLKVLNNGDGSVAIADGQIEIYIGSLTHLIQAGQQVDFDKTHIIKEASIVGTDIAPWRQ
jgi:ferric-dicitrate binding protein FerR (iron transport regulator)